MSDQLIDVLSNVYHGRTVVAELWRERSWVYRFETGEEFESLGAAIAEAKRLKAEEEKAKKIADLRREIEEPPDGGPTDR